MDEVNPQRSQYRRAAAAEEAVISVLIKHPDALDNIRSELDPSDFLTDFNRKLFERVVSILETGHQFDLVLLGADFTAEEMSFIAKLQTLGTASENYQKVLDDSVKVLHSEKEQADTPDISGLDDDAWAEAMANIIKNKKK